MVTFRQRNGTCKVVGAREGETLMEAAVHNGVDGIDALCGGVLSCATCHVRVSSEWISRLPPAAADELAMLEFAVDVGQGSRLSCQIQMTSELEGMAVDIPARQQ